MLGRGVPLAIGLLTLCVASSAEARKLGSGQDRRRTLCNRLRGVRCFPPPWSVEDIAARSGRGRPVRRGPIPMEKGF
jgi:hypothetical protein